MKKNVIHIIQKLEELPGEREFYYSLLKSQNYDKGSISDVLQYSEIDVDLKLQMNNV
jgi:hypothetical protein